MKLLLLVLMGHPGFTDDGRMDCSRWYADAADHADAKKAEGAKYNI